MTEKVVSLKGEPIYGGGQADPEVVKELEDWLEKARAGEVIGIAVAAYWRDKACGAKWVGTVSRGMVGECFGLAHRITVALDEMAQE